MRIAPILSGGRTSTIFISVSTTLCDVTADLDIASVNSHTRTALPFTARCWPVFGTINYYRFCRCHFYSALNRSFAASTSQVWQTVTHCVVSGKLLFCAEFQGWGDRVETTRRLSLANSVYAMGHVDQRVHSPVPDVPELPALEAGLYII